jgi:hypothetical protein
VAGGNDELREALQRVAVTLKHARVSFALGGGYAAWARGGPEPGHDVDFVIVPDDVEPAAKALDTAGLAVERPAEDWLFKAWLGDAMVDLVHSIGGRDVDAGMIGRAVELPVMSIRMPVLAATDVIASKLLALSEHECDYGKVLPAARAMREQVDWSAVRHGVAGNPYAQAFLFLGEQLGVVPDPAQTS